MNKLEEFEKAFIEMLEKNSEKLQKMNGFAVAMEFGNAIKAKLEEEIEAKKSDSILPPLNLDLNINLNIRTFIHKPEVVK